jgi:diguanylate cyclase (GGDEF)-like protein
VPGHVLVIDDDADATDVMVGALESAGWRVWVADDLDGAVGLLRDHGPDVLIADMRQRGLRAALRRAEVSPSVVAVSTGDAGDADALVAGATAIVRHPIDAAGIVAGVEDAMTAKKVQLPGSVDRDRVIHRLVERTRAAERKVQTLQSTDYLTGLLDRRGLGTALSSEVRRTRRSEASLSAMLVEIDDFRAVNKKWGHGWGDTVLRRVAHMLVRTLREVDQVGRSSADGFLALLPETSDQEAELAANRVREAVANSVLSHDGKELAFSVKVTAGPVLIEDGVESLLRRMYGLASKTTASA